MKPTTFDIANCKLIGDGRDVGDLDAYRYTLQNDGRVVATFTETRWTLNDEERRAIADGACIVLTVMGQAFYPVRIEVNHHGSIVPDDD